MSLSTIAKRLFDADTKVLIEAGYLNNELKLTSLGQLALIQEYFFNGGKEKLVVRANEKVAEEAKKTS